MQAMYVCFRACVLLQRVICVLCEAANPPGPELTNPPTRAVDEPNEPANHPPIFIQLTLIRCHSPADP